MTRAVAGVHPEIGAGGFSKLDGTVEFYGRVRALLHPQDTVVDLGAGRGLFVDDPVPYRRELRRLRGHVRELIGVDVDPAVLANPSVDRAELILDGALPLPDASVDLVVSDYVLEHVEDPATVAAELERVLRPGGWFCARTPNKWGPIGVGGRLVPNAGHVGALARLQPGKKEVDTFPTAYRLNSRAALRRHFPSAAWEDFTYFHDNELMYGSSSRALVTAHRAFSRLAPERCASMIMVFLRRRSA